MNLDLLWCFKRMKASTISTIFQPPPKRSAKKKMTSNKVPVLQEKDKDYTVSLVTVKL